MEAPLNTTNEAKPKIFGVDCRYLSPTLPDTLVLPPLRQKLKTRQTSSPLPQLHLGKTLPYHGNIRNVRIPFTQIKLGGDRATNIQKYQIGFLSEISNGFFFKQKDYFQIFRFPQWKW
jgi:hypothetical protein